MDPRSRKHLVVLQPSAWDYQELSRPEITGGLPVVFYEDASLDDLHKADPMCYLERLSERLAHIRPRGILSTDDYPGSLFASIAAVQAGLPGTSPEAALTCQHKYLCRLKQQSVVPEAVPKFWLVSRRKGASAQRKFPYFVKPVKSLFQLYAAAVHSESELRRVTEKARPHLNGFTKPFSVLLRRYLRVGGGNRMLGEELLSGKPFTVEGFAFRGQIHIHGIVDAQYYHGTRSYHSFHYPSDLPPETQGRITAIVERLMPALGYEHGAFNIDGLYDAARDKVWLLEVNSRLAPQLADLFEKVDGTSTYVALTYLATARRPAMTVRQGKYKVAGSFVFRRFSDGHITAMAKPEALLRIFPDARVHIYYEAGQKLSDDDFQDLGSYAYAIVNLGAGSRRELLARACQCRALLGAKFRALRRRRRIKRA